MRRGRLSSPWKGFGSQGSSTERKSELSVIGVEVDLGVFPFGKTSEMPPIMPCRAVPCQAFFIKNFWRNFFKKNVLKMIAYRIYLVHA
jgi:hypothetical protein